MALKAFAKYKRASSVLTIGGPEVPWTKNKVKVIEPLKVDNSLEGRRVEQMHRMLDKAEAEIVDHPVKPDRFFYMRPSGFPYCGLRKLLTAQAKLTEGDTSELAGSYFTSVGTAAHTVFQSHIGRLGEMVGDWKCKHCGKFTKFTTFKLCECGHKPEYEELEIKYKNTVIGHLDGLVRLKGRDPKTGKRRYMVVDYKTATGSKIEKGQKDSTIFPYAYNVQQIKRYVVLMELCFGIHVEGWMLIYLNRDVPLGRKNRKLVYREVLAEEKAELVLEMKRWIKVHRRVLMAQTSEEFEFVRDNKLCVNDADYKANWESPYQPCPIRPYCFDAKKLNKLMDRRLKESNVYPLINMAPEHLLKGLAMEKVKKVKR
jgi:hypothetical protein